MEASCPICHIQLENTLLCGTYETVLDSSKWIHPSLEWNSVSRPPRGENNFQKAATLLGLTSGINFIDRLIGGLKAGSFITFFGSSCCLTLAERLCLRAQLAESSGLDNPTAVWLDAGNSFDLYLFTSLAREHGIDMRRALEKIIISRAFTIYQLHSLVKQSLPEILDTYNSKFVVISNIFDMFTDGDVKSKEAQLILVDIRRAIQEMCREKGVVIFVTAWTINEHLKHHLFDHANVLVKLVEEGSVIRADLLRCPDAQQRTPMQEMVRTSNSYNMLGMKSTSGENCSLI